MKGITKDEKDFILAVLKQQLNKFEKEGKTVTYHEMPLFLAVEKEYDVFLRELIKKIKTNR